MLRRVLALAIVALAAAACGGGEADEPPAERPSAPELEGRLTYTRGGGIAGRMDRLEIEPDGRARLTARTGAPQTFALTADELAELRRLVAAADLASLPPTSTPARPIPDAFVHRVAYGGHTVTAAAEQAPARLRPLIGRLSTLVDRRSRG